MVPAEEVLVSDSEADARLVHRLRRMISRTAVHQLGQEHNLIFGERSSRDSRPEEHAGLVRKAAVPLSGALGWRLCNGRRAIVLEMAVVDRTCALVHGARCSKLIRGAAGGRRGAIRQPSRANLGSDRRHRPSVARVLRACLRMLRGLLRPDGTLPSSNRIRARHLVHGADISAGMVIGNCSSTWGSAFTHPATNTDLGRRARGDGEEQGQIGVRCARWALQPLSPLRAAGYARVEEVVQADVVHLGHRILGVEPCELADVGVGDLEHAMLHVGARRHVREAGPVAGGGRVKDLGGLSGDASCASQALNGHVDR